ncbi:diacylglycerol kinase 3 [Euphorbia peplus]|nr:diacylglycerol kinase 3 [Euphorbia peplus]
MDSLTLFFQGGSFPFAWKSAVKRSLQRASTGPVGRLDRAARYRRLVFSLLGGKLDWRSVWKAFKKKMEGGEGSGSSRDAKQSEGSESQDVHDAQRGQDPPSKTIFSWSRFCSPPVAQFEADTCWACSAVPTLEANYRIAYHRQGRNSFPVLSIRDCIRGVRLMINRENPTILQVLIWLKEVGVATEEEYNLYGPNAATRYKLEGIETYPGTSVASIQRGIQEYGPVLGYFKLHSDFANNEVYYCARGEILYMDDDITPVRHGVMINGWGTIFGENCWKYDTGYGFLGVFLEKILEQAVVLKVPAIPNPKRQGFNDRLGLLGCIEGDDDNRNEFVRTLQRTKSCCSSGDDVEDIDRKADVFIENFRRQLLMEGQVSLQVPYYRGNSFSRDY